MDQRLGLRSSSDEPRENMHGMVILDRRAGVRAQGGDCLLKKPGVPAAETGGYANHHGRRRRAPFGDT